MSRLFVVFPGEGVWHVGTLRDDDTVSILPAALEPDASVEQRVESATDRLHELGRDDEPVVLAIDSRDCLCAGIDTTDLDRRGRRAAMDYRLEEHLPISAEDFTADYLEMAPDAVLGVCARTEAVREILDALEARGVEIRHVCPEALLAAAAVVDRCPDADALVLRRDAGGDDEAGPTYDWLRLRERRPVEWCWFSDDETGLREHLAAIADEAEDGPLRTATLGCDEEAAASLTAPDGVELLDQSDTSVRDAAVRGAAGAVVGGRGGWINLRTGPLAPPDRYRLYAKPLRALAAAAVLLLTCIAGGAYYRGTRYEAQADELTRQQVKLFRDTIRDQRVPANIRARLRSERARLAGLGGRAAGGDRRALRPTSALVHLRNILIALPEGLRFRIIDLNIAPDLIRVNGHARDLADAESLTSALRDGGAYRVRPPETNALDQRSVRFEFTAEPADARIAGRADR